MAFSVGDIDESQAPLLDHLIELRTRLLRWSMLALILAFCVCFYFARRHLRLPGPPADRGLSSGAGQADLHQALRGVLRRTESGAVRGLLRQLSDHRQPDVGLRRARALRQGKAAFLPFLLATPVLFTWARRWPITW
jgi:sec-independent protein translocase protein TatC